MENMPRLALLALPWLLLSLLAVWIPSWWLCNRLASPIFNLPALSFVESTGLLIYVWPAWKRAANVKIEFTKTHCFVLAEL